MYIADQQFDASVDVSQLFIQLIREQKFQCLNRVESEQIQRKSSLKWSRREQFKDEMLTLSLPDDLRRSVELAAENVNQPAWLHYLLKIKAFAMHKGELQYALHLIPEYRPSG